MTIARCAGRNYARLLASKAEGMFPSELCYYVSDINGTRSSHLIDVSHDEPFGLRVQVLEIEPGGHRVLVRLPNGEGAAVVHSSQLEWA